MSKFASDVISKDEDFASVTQLKRSGIQIYLIGDVVLQYFRGGLNIRLVMDNFQNYVLVMVEIT